MSEKRDRRKDTLNPKKHEEADFMMEDELCDAFNDLQYEIWRELFTNEEIEEAFDAAIPVNFN
jgi:hypothetical protein